MDFKEIDNKTAAELQRELNDSQEALRDLRFKASNHQLKNVRAIRQAKKHVARLQTSLTKKSKQA